MVTGQSAAAPQELYRMMRLIRRFEERATDLVRSGEIVSGIHPCIGQEAVAAGIGAALRRDDLMVAHHRSHGHLLAKGTDPGRLLAEMAGRTGGVARGRGGSFHPSDFSVGVLACTGTVGHGAAIAAGAAWALARKGTDRIAIAIFGDGAVNQGSLFEAFNLASLWRAPVVFACENNLYATTLPVGAAVAGSIPARAAAFGMPADSCDGMDPDIVYEATAAAVDRARGGQPSFLEFTTYRYEGHHTFELKSGLRYRDPAEVAAWRARDPVALQASRIPESTRQQADDEVEAALEEAIRYAAGSPRPDPADAMDYLYSDGLRPRAGISGGPSRPPAGLAARLAPGTGREG
jgi:pyruvate dehydrogenase E1 component alpha subunit